MWEFPDLLGSKRERDGLMPLVSLCRTALPAASSQHLWKGAAKKKKERERKDKLDKGTVMWLHFQAVQHCKEEVVGRGGAKSPKY